MDFFRAFYRAYKKRTPAFLQAVIRPFWRFIIKIKTLFHCVICVKTVVSWKRADFVYKTFDYVRHSSLELIAREIYENNIGGNVAELGVFQGDFAQYINQIFPDRKLYLFDTFEGFNENDVRTEKTNKSYVPDNDIFKNTSINMVLGKMRHKENCVIKKGYFPETAKDVDDTFAFVNIDVDLSEPIYNGLWWFYSRLEKGGYIFVHDFNHKRWTGAKIGVKKFVKEYGGVPYFPLSDGAGSVIFMK
ncbi:MAG: TylF/MycF family methyltransferase [Spirochaetaceae bacterium]|jgi:O-methyltransferase|nr:TylF/MycF family methyltransferase [Spirochaetaceae bacterium]